MSAYTYFDVETLDTIWNETRDLVDIDVMYEQTDEHAIHFYT